MLRNVNVNVDLCSRLYWELVRWLTIAKSQALEIIYRAGGRCRESGSWGGARTKCEVNECELTKNMFFHSDFLQSCLHKKQKITELFPDTTVFYD